MILNIIPDYSYYITSFFKKSKIERSIICASFSATECWLYNEKIVPAETDIRVIRQAILTDDCKEALSFVGNIPLYQRYLMIYRPMGVVIRLMFNEFKQSIDLQQKLDAHGNAIEISSSLFKTIVGFPLNETYLTFAKEFANNLLKRDLPSDFICPDTISPYTDWPAYRLIDYPSDFIFRKIKYKDIPQQEKQKISKSLLATLKPDTYVDWFANESWEAGVNPVDEFRKHYLSHLK